MEKKRCFYNLRWPTNLLWQWCVMLRKLNLSHTCFNSSEGQESCNSLAKTNFVMATFWKIGAMCDRVKKKTPKLLENVAKSNLKLKQRKHCISRIFQFECFRNLTDWNSLRFPENWCYKKINASRTNRHITKLLKALESLFNTAIVYTIT